MKNWFFCKATEIIETKIFLRIFKDKQVIIRLASFFWKFLQNDVNLFYLRTFVENIVEELSSYEIKEVEWSIYKTSFVKMFYNRLKTKRVYMRSLSGKRRKKFSYTEFSKLKEVNLKKQKIAFQANLIHSVDGYIMLTVIGRMNCPIIAIHDLWGVPFDRVEVLRETLATLYTELSNNLNLYNFIIDEFFDLVKQRFDEEVAFKFRQSIKDKAFKKMGNSLGELNLSVDELKRSKFFIVYGT